MGEGPRKAPRSGGGPAESHPWPASLRLVLYPTTRFITTNPSAINRFQRSRSPFCSRSSERRTSRSCLGVFGEHFRKFRGAFAPGFALLPVGEGQQPPRDGYQVKSYPARSSPG